MHSSSTVTELVMLSVIQYFSGVLKTVGFDDRADLIGEIVITRRARHQRRIDLHQLPDLAGLLRSCFQLRIGIAQPAPGTWCAAGCPAPPAWRSCAPASSVSRPAIRDR